MLPQRPNEELKPTASSSSLVVFIQEAPQLNSGALGRRSPFDEVSRDDFRMAVAPALTHRLARREDLDALRALMDAAITELQKPYLDARQIAASQAFMGLDTQLIDDATYYLVESGHEIAGCGGWSRRATLYGNDQSSLRNPTLLDPTTEAARIRAMYTHPSHVRKGVGRLILTLCEEAARREGFRRAELVATLAGQPLYRACGYEALDDLTDERGGVPVPLIRMVKAL